MFYNNDLIYPWFLEFSPSERKLIKKFFQLINLGLEKLQFSPKSNVLVEIELLGFINSTHKGNNHLACDFISDRMMELVERVIEKENTTIKPLCWSNITINKKTYPITVTLENLFNGTKTQKYLIKIRNKDSIQTEKIYNKPIKKENQTNFEENYL
ncbi:hypothetical protein KKC17_00575 [Patescibacteria group bacterium]|nr:hypothetical protein [Patescibacteria group bacterium]